MPILKSIYDNRYNEIYNGFKEKYSFLIDKAEDKSYAIHYYKNEYINLIQKDIHNKYKVFGREFFHKIMNFRKLGFDFQHSFEETDKYFREMYEDNKFLPEYSKFIDKPIEKIIDDTAEFFAYSNFLTNFEKEFDFIDNTFSANVIEKRLFFLKGNNKSNEKIMNDNDFDRLIAYTSHLLENKQVPEFFTTIKPIKISNNSITYTYYLIHKDLFGTSKIYDFFIDFLHSIFEQLKNTEKSTLKAKFATEPKKYPF